MPYSLANSCYMDQYDRRNVSFNLQCQCTFRQTLCNTQYCPKCTLQRAQAQARLEPTPCAFSLNAYYLLHACHAVAVCSMHQVPFSKFHCISHITCCMPVMQLQCSMQYALGVVFYLSLHIAYYLLLACLCSCSMQYAVRFGLFSRNLLLINSSSSGNGSDWFSRGPL